MEPPTCPPLAKAKKTKTSTYSFLYYFFVFCSLEFQNYPGSGRSRVPFNFPSSIPQPSLFTFLEKKKNLCML